MHSVPTAASATRNPQKQQQHKEFVGLARIYGGRNAMLGLLTKAIRLCGDRQLMGYFVLAASLQPLGDGLIQYLLTGTAL